MFVGSDTATRTSRFKPRQGSSRDFHAMLPFLGRNLAKMHAGTGSSRDRVAKTAQLFQYEILGTQICLIATIPSPIFVIPFYLVPVTCSVPNSDYH